MRTAQTRKTLDNMKLALAAAGATLDDVVKVTVYLANVDDRPKVNEARKEYAWVSAEELSTRVPPKTARRRKPVSKRGR